MRLSSIIACLCAAAMLVSALGMPATDAVEEGVPVKALWAQQSDLFDELVAEDSETELAQEPPADLNADNGTPINVAQDSVHEEVYRFVQYEFGFAYSACNNGTTDTAFKVYKTLTQVAQGIDYEVEFTYGDSAKYTMKVLRDPIGNPKELPGEQEVVRDEFKVLSIEPPVCPELASWTATQYPQFEGLSDEQFSKRYFGDKAPKPTDFLQSEDEESTATSDAALPVGFDWRDHMGPSEGMKVIEQGECSSCYATAAASVMSDRFYIGSKGAINVAVSPQSIMDCSNGCDGGTASDAFKAMMTNKAAPNWCDPYTGAKGTCGASKCTNATEYSCVIQGDKMATLGIQGVGKQDAIMYQLFHYGPVYMRMMVYSDFPYYRSGVYKHQLDAKVRGDHAVKLIGWGEEGSVKYWLAQNSWGSKWGEKGFFRIARGEDESGVESRGVFWAIPDVKSVCPGAPACNNGGSFTGDCGCHCAEGYSGDTCDTCTVQCQGEGFTGNVKSDECACECAPGYFDGEVDGVHTPCGLKIGGAKAVETHEIAPPPCVNSESDDTCAKWAGQGFCEGESKYHDYTTLHCQKSCEQCDTTPSAQIPVMVEGHLTYQYGDMVVAVPASEEPWNIHRGWADKSAYSFVCGSESSYEESLFCEDRNPVEVKIPEAGPYDLYFLKFLGKNLLGQSRGWSSQPKKLAVAACAGGDDCIFPKEEAAKPKSMSETQKAEVEQRVADAALSAAKKAKKDLQDERKKFAEQEAEAHNKILKAAKLAHTAEVKKEAAEAKVKAAMRGKETKELNEKTKDVLDKDKAKAKEIDEKRSEEAKKSDIADDKRHEVVESITRHKKVLDKLGEISATLADEQAHIAATAKMAAKEKDYKVAKAQAEETTEQAKGDRKAAMRKSAELAKKAAAAVDLVKKDTIAEKVAEQKELEATQKSKDSDKAHAINQDYKNKKAATTLVHEEWEKKAVVAEKNVTDSKQIAVNAMEEAQCIIKDHRSGCKTDSWKGHCKVEKWKAWMITHCTESCGYSCTDLHDLAMAVILEAEHKLGLKQTKARVEACPRFNKITEEYKKMADKNGMMSTKEEQACNMREEDKACEAMKKYAKLSQDFEKKHEEFKQHMQLLKCYEYHSQWAAGSGVGFGSAGAGGKHLTRMLETDSMKTKSEPLFANTDGPGH